MLHKIPQYMKKLRVPVLNMGCSLSLAYLHLSWIGWVGDVTFPHLRGPDDRTPSEFLESISPSNKIENVKSPILIIQGDNDERVPLSESIQMYEKLKDQNIPTQLLRFEDEGHGVIKRKNVIKQYKVIFEFLKTHLKN